MKRKRFWESVCEETSVLFTIDVSMAFKYVFDSGKWPYQSTDVDLACGWWVFHLSPFASVRKWRI